MAQGIWTPGGGFDRQPQGPVEVDWGNPIARGLVHAINAAAGVAGSRLTVASGSPSIGPIQTGQAFTGTTRLVGSAVNTLTNFTALVVMRQVASVPPSGQPKVAVSAGNFWMGNSDSTISGAPVISNSVLDTTAGAFAAGAIANLVAVRNAGNFMAWLNGVKGSTSTAVPTTTGNLTIKDYSSGGFAFPEGISLVLWWNRALSDAEIASISANPWQLFHDDTSDVLIFDMGAGGGAGSHTLTGANSTQSNTGTTAAIAQAHALAGANGVQANTAGTGSIGSDITLAGAAGSSANTGSVGAIGQVHVLVGAASAQANGGGTGAITQVHALAGANATQANTGSTAALGETVITLAGSAGSSANTGSAGAITQAHVLVGAASVQDNVAAASAIVQAHVLAGAAAVQSNLGSVGAITAFDFSTAASPYVAYVPYTNHIAFVPAVSNTALRGL